MSATTEKKPLLIQIPGEITPNVLPVSASAVGYDFVQGNYIYYATGSDSWVTAPPNGGGGGSFAINSQLSVINGTSSPVDAGAFYIPSTTTFTTIEAGIMSADYGNPRIRILTAVAGTEIYNWASALSFDGPGWRVVNLSTAAVGSVAPPYVFSTGWYRVLFDNATGNLNPQVLMSLRLA